MSHKGLFISVIDCRVQYSFRTPIIFFDAKKSLVSSVVHKFQQHDVEPDHLDEPQGIATGLASSTWSKITWTEFLPAKSTSIPFASSAGSNFSDSVPFSLAEDAIFFLDGECFNAADSDRMGMFTQRIPSTLSSLTVSKMMRNYCS